VVVTREFSDWSVKSLETAPAAIWLKLRREHDFVEISYSLDAERFHMLRLAYFPSSVEMQVGIMAAAPEGNGFKALFEKFQLRNL
jgi:regulation of enolase protein 1 (concanavalin A-like superfamily)